MMSTHVLTYATVDQLYEKQSLFRKYSNVLHITATSTLRRGMMEHMAEEERLLTAPILTFAQLLNLVGCEIWPWYSGKTQLKQYALISETLRRLSETSMIEDEKVYNAMSKNKDVLLRTLRMLTESGETSESIERKLSSQKSEEEQLALIIWRELEKDETFDSFYTWLKQFGQNKDHFIENSFITIFENILQNNEERQASNILPLQSNLSEEDLKNAAQNLTVDVLKSKQILLHGFYFITPIQQQMIKALEQAGYTIIHLIHYQKDYPNVFEAVDVFLDNQQNTFQQVSQTPPFFNKIAQKFLHICEGDFDLNIEDMPDKYFEFNHMYQFKEYIENDMRQDKEVHDLIISPRAREVRQQVEDMGSMKPLTLKDYPIGQFLIDLHGLNMTTFDEKSKQFIDREELNVDILMRIFSTGYIHVQNVTTRDLVKDLLKLRERFIGKEGFEEWKQEIQNIMDEKQQIEEDLTPKGVEVTTDNEIYMYKNRLLSYYDLSNERLQMILEALQAVESLYADIFTEDSTVKVRNYVERLMQHINKEIIPHIEQEDERVIAKELLTKLEQMGDSDFNRFDRQDLIQGLRFFISGELDNNDNSLFGESLIDSKIVSLQDGDILPYLDNQSVHLAFLDNKALPLSQNLVTWPFNDDSMDVLYLHSLKNDGENSYLHLIQKRKKYDAAITKYLLYLIMVNATSLKFSIVSNLGAEKELKRSFYLDLLGLTKASDEAKNNKDANARQVGYKPRTVSFTKRKATKLIDFTKNICQKRMVFSYLLQKAPSFETEFHHRFLYENYIAQLHCLGKGEEVQPTPQEIRNIVSAWFPHWNETKQQMLATKAEKWDYSAYPITIDGVRFDDNLTRMSLFGSLKKDDQKFANAGAHCKYCPFQDRCRESKFLKDE